MAIGVGNSFKTDLTARDIIHNQIDLDMRICSTSDVKAV